MNVELEMKRWREVIYNGTDGYRSVIDVDKAIEIAREFAKEARQAEAMDNGVFEVVERAIVDHQCSRYREIGK